MRFVIWKSIKLLPHPLLFDRLHSLQHLPLCSTVLSPHAPCCCSTCSFIPFVALSIFPAPMSTAFVSLTLFRCFVRRVSLQCTYIGRSCNEQNSFGETQHRWWGREQLGRIKNHADREWSNTAEDDRGS